MIFLLLIGHVLVGAQRSEVQPILRLENGSHFAQMKGISVDALNRYVVTCSDDKTARVWDLDSGRLITVLRPPIGEGQEGMLYSVSISPNGDFVAVGGWTGSRFDNSIYIFERESGRIQTRITGLPDVIHYLSYSPDGRYLAATIGGKEGLRLYETQSYQLIGKDVEYESLSKGLDFDLTSKRFVTSSFDGHLRLYEIRESGLRLVNKQLTKGGKEPVGVKFSPDGARIAVGFSDSPGIEVVNSLDLGPMYSPDVAKVGDRAMGSVAWSTDGRTLYAAGLYRNANRENLVCYWTDNGRTYHEALGGRGTIFDLRTLLKGGVVFGTGPPGWGVIDGTGARA
jgi:WD40 repeat protein